MTFRDERLDLVNYDTIMGQAMRKPRTVEHEELAAQMAEWEKTNTVKVYSSGQTEAKPKVDPAQYDKSSKKAISTNSCGYLNITIDVTGGYHVMVARVYCGTFRDIDSAIFARDRHRKAVGLPPAVDKI